MAAIDDFEKELVSVIGKPNYLRPFVCNGSPLDCKVFIVGTNSATEMSADFWDFWCSGKGFDKPAWFDAYMRERRNSITPSRRVIDSLVKEASPVQILETNIYAAPTKKEVDLALEQQTTETIDFLIKSIQPRVIVAHGKPAATHLQGKDLNAHVIAVPHFARGWFPAAVRSLEQQIRRERDA